MEDETVDPVEPQDLATEEPVDPAEPADPAPADPQDPSADPAAEPAHKENKVQKRIDEITRARRQAEAEADYWRKVATGEIQPPKQEPVQPQGDFIPPGYPAEPTLDAFDDYDQYNRALVRWEAGRIIAERDHTAQQAQKQTAQQAVFKTHVERMEAAKEKYADLDEVLALAPDCQFNQDAFNAILESDQSADIVYHLSKHAKEAERIAAMPPVKQIMEIARLEDKFKAAPAQPVKRVSQAPTPLNPIGGGGDPAPKDPDKMSDEEWLAYERKRVQALGRRY